MDMPVVAITIAIIIVILLVAKLIWRNR